MALNVRRPTADENEADLISAMEKFDVASASVANVVTNYRKEDRPSIRDVDKNSALSRVLSDVVVERDRGVKETAETARPKNTIKGKSIFAQRHAKSTISTATTSITSSSASATTSVTSSSPATTFPTSSGVSAMLSEVSRENAERLSSMSASSIAEARQQILRSLSPQAIDLIRKRNNGNNDIKEKQITDEKEKGIRTGPAQYGGSDGMDGDNGVSDGAERGQVQPHEVKKNYEEEKKQGLSDSTRNIDSKETLVSSTVHELASKFPQLGPIETSKLQWTSETIDSESPKMDEQGARFDLKGELVFESQESHLFHHGDEPHRPGYTIEELLTLARSTHVPQQVLATETLALIVMHHKCGHFVHQLKSSVLEALLGRGQLLFLLRSAVDDNSRLGLREAALFCLSNLLYNHVDELGLDNDFSSASGHVQPRLRPVYNRKEEQSKEEKEEEEKSLRDVDVLNRDVVEGLVLRLDLHRRLGFLFGKNVSNCTANALRTLIRLSRHSESMAFEVFSAFDINITSNLLQKSAEKNDKELLVLLLKWLRVTIQWNHKKLNAAITGHCNLEQLISRFVAVETDEKSAIDLLMESLRLLATSMLVGEMDQLFVDLFPLIINQLIATRAFVERNEPKLHLHSIALWFKVVFVAIKRSDKGVIDERHLKDITALMESIIETVVHKWTKNEGQDDKDNITRAAILLLSSGLPVLKLSTQSSLSSRQFLLEKIINPLNQSHLWQFCLTSCSNHSSLLQDNRLAPLQPPRLPSVEAIGLTRIFLGISPFHLLATVTDILIQDEKTNSNKHLNLLFTKTFMDYINNLLKATLNSSNEPICPWFEAEELRLLANAVVLQSQATVDERVRDEKMLNLSTMLLELMLDRHDRKILRNLLKAHFELLYRSAKRDEHEVERIRALYYQEFLENSKENGLSLVAEYSSRWLPSDWLFTPLQRLIRRNVANEADTEVVLRALHFVLDHVSFLQGNFSRRIALLTRVAELFMLDSALFMDNNINEALFQILKSFLTKNIKPIFYYGLNVKAWPSSYASCHHFYDAFLQQFKAVSYNERVFSLYLLILPLYFPKEARDAALNLLWAENLDVLASLRLAVSDLEECGLTTDAFIVDKDVLSAQVFKCALGEVCEKRSSLVFNIAKQNVIKRN